MNTTPDIALAVAALALVGVLVTALVATVNARKRGDTDQLLVNLKAELDALNAIDLVATQNDYAKKLTDLEHAHALKIGEIQYGQSQDLQKLAHQNEVELKKIEARLQQQLSAERMREVLNEANWKRVHEQIRKLKTVGLSMVDAFSAIALRGHETADEKLVPEVASALKLHTEFKDLISEVRAEIRDEDYWRLSALHKYLVEVFLDLARTQSERITRAGVMAAHAKRIATEEQYIVAMASHFLQPKMSSKGPSAQPLGD
jgi:hypothetical protein